MNQCFECLQPEAQQICSFCPKYFHSRCLVRTISQQKWLYSRPDCESSEISMCYYCNILHSQICRTCMTVINDDGFKNIFSGKQSTVNGDFENKQNLQQIRNRSTHSYPIFSSKCLQKANILVIKCSICKCDYHKKCTFVQEYEEIMYQERESLGLLKYFQSFICEFCVQRRGVCHLQKSIKVNNKQLCLVSVKHPSPIHLTWLSSNKLSTYSKRNSKITSYSSHAFLPVPEFSKPSNSSTCIEKILQIKVYKQGNERFAEQRLDELVERALMYYNQGQKKQVGQQILKNCENYGKLGNIAFLVKWQYFSWSMCTWEDETIIVFYPLALFRFVLASYAWNKQECIFSKQSIKKISKILSQTDKNLGISHHLLTEHFHDCFSDASNVIEIIDINFLKIIKQQTKNLGYTKNCLEVLREVFMKVLMKLLDGAQMEGIIVIVTQFKEIGRWKNVSDQLMPLTKRLIIEKLQDIESEDYLNDNFFRIQENNPNFNLLILSYESYNQLMTLKRFRPFWTNQRNPITNFLFDQFSPQIFKFLPRHLPTAKYIINTNSSEQLLTLLHSSQPKLKETSNLYEKSISKNRKQICNFLQKIGKNVRMMFIHEEESTNIDAFCSIACENEDLQERKRNESDEKNIKKLNRVNCLIFHEYVTAFGLTTFQKGTIKTSLIKFEPQYFSDIAQFSQQQFLNHLRRYTQILYHFRDQISEKKCKRLFFVGKSEINALYKHICNLAKLHSFCHQFTKQPFYHPNTFFPEAAFNLQLQPFLLFLIITFIIKFGYNWKSFKKMYALKNWSKQLGSSKEYLIKQKQSELMFGEFIFKQIEKIYKDGHHKYSQEDFIKRYINTCYIEVVGGLTVEQITGQYD